MNKYIKSINSKYIRFYIYSHVQEGKLNLPQLKVHEFPRGKACRLMECFRSENMKYTDKIISQMKIKILHKY